MAEPIDMPFGSWTWVSPKKHGLGGYCGCTLAQPGEYHWTIHVPWRCSLFQITMTICYYYYYKCYYYTTVLAKKTWVLTATFHRHVSLSESLVIKDAWFNSSTTYKYDSNA